MKLTTSFLGSSLSTLLLLTSLNTEAAMDKRTMEFKNMLTGTVEIKQTQKDGIYGAEIPQEKSKPVNFYTNKKFSVELLTDETAAPVRCNFTIYDQGKPSIGSGEYCKVCSGTPPEQTCYRKIKLNRSGGKSYIINFSH